MEKRTPQEKEKYQPSYDTTILSEVSMPVKFCGLRMLFLYVSKYMEHIYIKRPMRDTFSVCCLLT